MKKGAVMKLGTIEKTRHNMNAASDGLRELLRDATELEGMFILTMIANLARVLNDLVAFQRATEKEGA
jgi:hypothetical protein